MFVCALRGRRVDKQKVINDFTVNNEKHTKVVNENIEAQQMLKTLRWIIVAHCEIYILEKRFFEPFRG